MVVVMDIAIALGMDIATALGMVIATVVPMLHYRALDRRAAISTTLIRST